MGAPTPNERAGRVADGMARSRRRNASEHAFHGLLLFATLVGLVVLAVLLVDVFADGFGRLRPDFLTSYASSIDAEDAGVRTGLTGTLSLMVLTALIAFPIGVGAAVYLEEFASDNRFTRLMQLNIANLAGVPSVVYGLLAAAVFVYLLELGRSLISGALALSLLIMPIIIVAGREAIRAVPQTIRDGGLALGATPLQVTYKQVLPIALPGILTGAILALSRAIGEAAPLLVVGAVLSRRADNAPWDLLEPFGALPIQIYNWVTRPQEGFQVDAASAGIIVLLGALLVTNAVAILLRNRYARRW